MTNQSTPTSPADGASQVSLKQRFFNVRTLITFALSVAFLIFIFTRLNIDFTATWERIKHIRLLFYILAFVVYYITFPLRALRWKLMLKNAKVGDVLPSLPRLTEIMLLNFFTNCVLYARLGDIYRAYLLREDDPKYSFSKTLGTVLAERIIDVLVVVVLLVISALAFWHGWAGGAATYILSAGIGLLALMAALVVVMWRFGHRIEPRLPEKVRSLYRHFHEGTLGSFRQMPILLFLSVLIWLLEGGRLLMVSYALGLHIGLWLVLFVSLANAVIVALPFTPGGLGLVESGLTGLFMLSPHMVRSDAVSLVLVDRTVSYLSLVVFGLILFLAIQFWRKRRKAATRAVDLASTTNSDVN